LEFLYDGKNSGNTWYPNKNTFLTMTFPELTRILGVRINFDTGYYSLGSLNVYADEGNGFISYGKLTRNANGTIYLKFKEPADIRALKFDGIIQFECLVRKLCQSMSFQQVEVLFETHFDILVQSLFQFYIKGELGSFGYRSLFSIAKYGYDGFDIDYEPSYASPRWRCTVRVQ
jgi:hypothetical protein